jgi:hypothetical protein
MISLIAVKPALTVILRVKAADIQAVVAALR